MPKRKDLKKILVVGAGPIIIGQACEFDYSGTQACKALRDEGYKVVLINSNPATIMTDPDVADKTYIEPITLKVLEKIHKKLPEEKIFAIFPAGGVSGTSKEWYVGENGSYVFAKIGTLSGKHCLSVYLKTKKGKTLIFSFMQNKFKGISNPWRREMEKILKGMYEEY